MDVRRVGEMGAKQLRLVEVVLARTANRKVPTATCKLAVDRVAGAGRAFAGAAEGTCIGALR